jgi:protein-S-isoprenylcysteine O-methyltransferase Ste14
MIGYIGLLGFIAGVVALNKYGAVFLYERSVEALILASFCAVPMVVVRLLTNTELWAQIGIPSISTLLQGCFVRLLGLSLTIAAVGFVYWGVSEYHASFMAGVFEVNAGDNNFRPYYYNWFRVFGLFGRHILTAYVAYILATELLLSLRDDHWVVGNAALSSLVSPFSSDAAAAFAYDPMELRRIALEWAVRMFWSPLMFCYICDNLSGLHYRPHELTNYMSFFRFANNMIFTVDVCFAAIGYALPGTTVLGTHFRSAEFTAYGWCVALICYFPFFSLFCDRYFDYSKNPPWNEWFDRMNGQQDAQHWVSFQAWGNCIIALNAVFAWCTISFGLNYSNLSHRGIVTHGPYALLRHPAYVVKLLSFAMLSVPWADMRGDAGAYRGVRNCLALLLLAGVYVLRARTEEAHLLSVDGGREYLQYLAGGAGAGQIKLD